MIRAKMAQLTRQWWFRWIVGPVLVYGGLFLILTWPLVTTFTSHIWAVDFDGFQNLWNLWWVKKAVLSADNQLWYTSYLFYPQGSTLVGHPLNVTSGVIGILLNSLMPLYQVYNVLLVLGFVLGGLAFYHLSYYLTRSPVGALVAGYLYTFSGYHYTHARQHLELVALYWLPWFLLAWLVFLRKGSWRWAAFAGVLLYANLVTTAYFFVYGGLIAAILLGFSVWNASERRQWLSERLFGLGVFGVVMAASVLPHLVNIASVQTGDAFTGTHLSEIYSTDFLGFLVPGLWWQFWEFTAPLTLQFPGSIEENGSYLTLVGLGLAVGAWLNTGKKKELLPWVVIGVVFGILTLGPSLVVGGIKVLPRMMPYWFLEELVPGFKLSGLPVRMALGALIGVSILAGYGVRYFWAMPSLRKWLVALAVVMLVETWPDTFQKTAWDELPYVDYVKSAQGKGAVTSLYHPEYWEMMFQTIHEKPMVMGYLARKPGSVTNYVSRFQEVRRRHDFERLCREFKIQYVIAKEAVPALEEQQSLGFRSGNVRVYDLEQAGLCYF